MNFGHSPLDRRFLKILLDGTTSHNAWPEIEQEFREISKEGELKNMCCFYQGCGCDLITLACKGIHTHVLSDCDAGCEAKITGKLERMASKAFISKLRQGRDHYHFEMHQAMKSLVFTTLPIDEINFEQLTDKSLGLVFEYNCGDSARKRSFWHAISKVMVEGGHVIGSYARGVESANRVAFVLETNEENPILSGCDNYDNVCSSERIAVIEKARKLGILPAQPLDIKVIEHEKEHYKLNWAGQDRFAVTRIWRESVKTIGLHLTTLGDRICRLTKTN